MTQEESQKFDRNKRQRMIEYLVLIGFQGFFVTAFRHILHPLLAPVLGGVAFGLAWNLAQLREQRRTLALNDRRRLVGDALESMILLLSLVLIGIGGQFVDIPFVTVMAYLAVSLLGYFAGSFLGESVWMRRHVPTLSAEQYGRYIGNLNRSLVFPYNLGHLRRVFRSPRDRDE